MQSVIKKRSSLSSPRCLDVWNWTGVWPGTTGTSGVPWTSTTSSTTPALDIGRVNWVSPMQLWFVQCRVHVTLLLTLKPFIDVFQVFDNLAFDHIIYFSSKKYGQQKCVRFVVCLHFRAQYLMLCLLLLILLLLLLVHTFKMSSSNTFKKCLLHSVFEFLDLF